MAQSAADRTANGFAVVVCTSHAPAGVVITVRSALDSLPTPELVIVVDQSEVRVDDPLAEFRADPRFVRIRMSERGLSRARNVGIAAAEAAGLHFVALTDDDCKPLGNWLAGFAVAFAEDSRVALIFGTTRPADHDRRRGLIPGYIVHAPSAYEGLRSKPRIEGMGACMALRSVAWRQIGGFDESLGAGTPLAAAEENDLSARLLLAGYVVSETPDAEVLHFGFRDAASVDSLVAGYMRGSGAATAKMIRLAGTSAIGPVASIGWRWLGGKPGVDMGTFTSRWFRLRSFFEGFVVGWTASIDPRSGRFGNSCATRK